MGDKEGLYKGTLDCFVKTFRNDVSGLSLPRGPVCLAWPYSDKLPGIAAIALPGKHTALPDPRPFTC